MFKVNNRNSRTTWEICSTLTIKTPERHQWCRSSVFVINLKHMSHLVLVILLLTLSRQLPARKMYTRFNLFLTCNRAKSKKVVITPFKMFDWVLNKPLVILNIFYSLFFNDSKKFLKASVKHLWWSYFMRVATTKS